jgi:glycosyltransferase involved in cell wall biosynthesis
MILSVVVMTYNHVAFIAQAIDSVLMQEVECDYEILISEDCSTDGTREIVTDYQSRYPDRIRLLLSERNLRSNIVVRRGIEAARGMYIAFLDGDDYWTCADKLQKQLDFLTAHPHCSICFHNASVSYEDGVRAPWNWVPEHQPPFATFEDIWMGNFIPMCSAMFRRAALGEIPAWYEACFPITDWPLHILGARHGSIGYINEVMGVYRQHSGGLYSVHTEAKKLEKTLQFYRSMNANLDYRYDPLIRAAISKHFFEWAEEYEKRGDIEAARRCFRICFQGRPFNRFLSVRGLLKMGARLYLGPSRGHA